MNKHIVIPKETIEQTSFGCPSQWDAKTQERDYVYIRLRHGHFYIEVNSERVMSTSPEGFDGVMSTDEMIKHVNEQVNEDYTIIII